MGLRVRSIMLAAGSVVAGLGSAHGAWAQSCANHGPGAAPTYGSFASGGIANSYGQPSCQPGVSGGGGAYYFGTNTNSLTWDGSPAVGSASGSIGTQPWGLSSASVNLASGDITVSATSIGATPYDSTPPPTGVPASAQAGYFVELTFTGGQGDTATYSTGGLVSYSGNVSGTAAVNISLGTPAEIGANLGGGYNIVSGSDLASTTNQTWSTPLQSFTIEDGMTYTLGVELNVQTSGSFLPGSITMTDPFSLDLPQGVTFTASYEPFLSGGAPEPATWAMTLTGFASLGAMLRRRRSVQAS